MNPVQLLHLEPTHLVAESVTAPFDLHAAAVLTERKEPRTRVEHRENHHILVVGIQVQKVADSSQYLNRSGSIVALGTTHLLTWSISSPAS
jgi:hypothetical protein